MEHKWKNIVIIYRHPFRALTFNDQ